MKRPFAKIFRAKNILGDSLEAVDPKTHRKFTLNEDSAAEKNDRPRAGDD